MRTLHAMFTVLLLASISWAKTPLSDWGGVEDIPTGWRIAVVTEFTFPCIFVQASADELVCRIPRRRWDERDLPETHVRRDRVREVRVDRRNGANALMGGAIGGGTGAGFGALASAGASGASAYGLGVVGVLLGARMGNDVHLLKGKVIYRASPSLQTDETRPPTLKSRPADAIVGGAQRPDCHL
ncbi:MAG TPA: hypothetical protein VL156_02095 [Terriglobales bacterium]|nr:hypothetical protein [Terriglobales bacterium]